MASCFNREELESHRVRLGRRHALRNFSNDTLKLGYLVGGSASESLEAAQGCGALNPKP